MGTVYVNEISPDTASSITITRGLFDKPTFTNRIIEQATLNGTAATGNVNIDMLDRGINYFTSNTTGNVTVNLRGNSTTTLNTMMANGDVASQTIMLTQGTTAYFVNNVQIDGVPRVVKWQNNTIPTVGNANSVDLYSLTVVKTDSNVYTIFGGQTQFK